MIARCTPIGRGWGWLAAGLLLAVAGLTDAAIPAPAAHPPMTTIAMTGQAEGKRPQAAIAAPEQVGKEPGQAASPVPEPIAKAIATLLTTATGDFKRWAKALRELVQIGKPAVPPLIEELDRTTDERRLRSLGFALRALSDPRAVPALIRAIPRTLVPAGSDYGLAMDDPELLALLQRHDLDKRSGGRLFTFGMPYREITGALHALTGQRFNEDELNFINLQGSAKQQWLQRWLFHELAARWAVWWKQNWQKFTDDPAYAKVSVPPLPEAPPVAAAAAGQPFPTGNNVRASSGWSGVILGPPQPQEYCRTFKDLDTGREIKWPKELPDPSKARDDDVAVFAAKEGFDLRGTVYTAPESGRSYYAIRGLGVRAWQIDNHRFETIEQDLQGGKPPKLDRPARDLLMDFDPATKTYHPENEATFLFVTREGTTGVLQVTNQVTELFRPEHLGKPVQEKSRVGFFLGVKFRYNFLYDEENEAHVLR